MRHEYWFSASPQQAPVIRASLIKSAIMSSDVGTLQCGQLGCNCPVSCLWNTWEFRTSTVEGVATPEERLVMVGKKHKNTSRGHAPITYDYEMGSALSELMRGHIEHGHASIVERRGRAHSRASDSSLFLSGFALPFNDATFCQVCGEGALHPRCSQW